MHDHPPIFVTKRTRETTRAATVAVAHDHVAVAFVTEGRLVMEQRQRFELAAGDLLLVPAGEKHRRILAEGVSWWGLGFCAPCVAPTELASLLEPFERARAGASFVVAIPAARRAHLATLFAELEHESHPVARRSLLALVLVEIERAASTTPVRARVADVVGDALRYIERHCLEPISLTDVAAAVHRSPGHVATALKRATGKTVGAWILVGRLAEARNRLLHGDEMVDVIAERVGYADATHFIRLFRREHGLTPAAWRSRARASARGSSARPPTPPRSPR